MASDRVHFIIPISILLGPVFLMLLSHCIDVFGGELHMYMCAHVCIVELRSACWRGKRFAI